MKGGSRKSGKGIKKEEKKRRKKKCVVFVVMFFADRKKKKIKRVFFPKPHNIPIHGRDPN